VARPPAGKLRFFALPREADDDVYREIACSELLPELSIDALLECMREPDQTSAVRALRAKLAQPLLSAPADRV
jgi:hypothetical protein